MSRSNLPPEFPRFAEQANTRLTRLERQLGLLLDQAADRDVFDLPGQLYVSESCRLPFIARKKAKLIQVTQGDPGDTDSEFELRRDGTAVATITLAAGTTQTELSLSQEFTPSNLASMACTVAGQNAVDTLVVVYWTLNV